MVAAAADRRIHLGQTLICAISPIPFFLKENAAPAATITAEPSAPWWFRRTPPFPLRQAHELRPKLIAELLRPKRQLSRMRALPAQQNATAAIVDHHRFPLVSVFSTPNIHLRLLPFEAPAPSSIFDLIEPSAMCPHHHRSTHHPSLPCRARRKQGHDTYFPPDSAIVLGMARLAPVVIPGLSGRF